MTDPVWKLSLFQSLERLFSYIERVSICHMDFLDFLKVIILGESNYYNSSKWQSG